MGREKKGREKVFNFYLREISGFWSQWYHRWMYGTSGATSIRVTGVLDDKGSSREDYFKTPIALYTF